MSKNGTLLALLIGWCSLAVAAEWHVSAISGSDANDGKTLGSAFQTLQKANAVVQPGDVVLVANGLYTKADKADRGAVLDITSSGRPEAWITWKPLPGHKPEVRGMGWAGIQVRGSYHVIDGFHVIGNNDAIVLLKAQQDAQNAKADPYFNTNGIVIQGRFNARDAKPHHIVIRNCVVAKNAGGGITVLEADYVTIEDNLVYDNAWFMRYGGSGISTLGNWAYDDKPGYHMVVQRNTVWNNKTLVPWEKVGRLSDGNGIIIDVTEADDGPNNPDADPTVEKQARPVLPPERQNRPPWTGRTLVANNLSLFNGGSGIHTFRAAHVDIINNTTYWNGGNVGYPELYANRSVDVTVLNNIIVPRPGGRVTSNTRNVGLRWDHNLYPVAQDIVKGPNDIVADPLFVRPQADPTLGGFRLAADSRGIDSGSDEVAQAVDLGGAPRPQGGARDRGAYENPARAPGEAKAAVAFPRIKPSLAQLKAGHPRLVFTPELEASLKARLSTDPLLVKLVARVRERSDAIAAEPPVAFVATPVSEFGMQMLPVSRAILERVTAHGLMYRLSGERRYAERLQREVETALAYPTWNPAHYLDAAEMLLAVSFAYDWAYDFWTPAQRAAMRQAMVERAIKRGLEIFETGTGLSAFFPTSTSNWNSVSNGALLAGALAMAEDEPEIARKVLAYSADSLAYPKSSFEPDGASDEGVTYWSYGADFYALGAAILNSALGSEAEMFDTRGVARAAAFRLHAVAPNGRNFSYADCWPRSAATVGYAFLAARFGPAPARQHVRELLAQGVDDLGKDSGTRLSPLIALWLPPAEAVATAALDAFFDGTAQLSMFRSAWNDPRAAYLGFKAGAVDHSHNHLDLGSFVFDQAGVRWSTDLGPDSYALPNYFRKETLAHFPLTDANRHEPHRWNYLRNINQGHSTLTLGDELQARTAVAPVTAKGSTPARAFTVAQLDAVYPGRARSWRRGVALLDRSWVAVRDELNGLQPGVGVEWGLMTEAEVKIAADGRSALLRKDGETLRLDLARAPVAARITAAAARPRTSAENQNEGITRVVVGWQADAADAVLEVHLVPATFKRPTPAQPALSAWAP